MVYVADGPNKLTLDSVDLPQHSMRLCIYFLVALLCIEHYDTFEVTRYDVCITKQKLKVFDIGGVRVQTGEQKTPPPPPQTHT